MTSRTRPGIALVALLAMVGPLAACGGSDEAGSDDSITADAPAGDSDNDVADAGGDAEQADEESGGAEEAEAEEADDESGDAEVRDAVTSVRESIDDVVEVTSDNGVLVVAGLGCPEDGDAVMLIASRGLTGDAEYVADIVPELSFEQRAVAQPDGTFSMGADADPDVTSYTITFPTIGSGVTLELPGCAS